MSSEDTILTLDLPLHSPSLPKSPPPKNPNPPNHTSKHFFTHRARPAHPPRRRRASLPSPGPAPQGTRAAAGTKRAPPARARPPRRRPSSAALTCRRPRAWATAPAAAAASLVVVALARRLRPPPPRSLSLPPPPALMRDPRFVLRSPRPGKGAQRPQKAPRPPPAAAPPLSVRTGGHRARLRGSERAQRGPPVRIGGAEGGAAARGFSARRQKRSASRRGGGWRAPEPAEGYAEAGCASERRALCRCSREGESGSTSPAVTPSRAPPSWKKRGSRGRSASREDWLGGPSIPAASAHLLARRGLPAWTQGRGAEPGRAREGAALYSAPNRRLRPLPACRRRSAKAAGKGKWLAGCSSQSHQGRLPSLHRGEGAVPL
ncbi:sterile alpha motif domain-containing protein 1-like [Bos indicus]|uniref:Sterile alpha motif domain-containing protein 1-like n=1 Tax=Bos indicus TaxID=9915 RepID=A0ABM4R981_BOSIN